MKYFVLLVAIFLYALSFPVVQAGTDDVSFTIRIGEDSAPPTTPTITTVTPTAFDQIDISWSSSTDDWIFGGYVLLRDGTPIATTTLTSYNDTGLTAETTYSYAVYAFDAAGNFSTTSVDVATTTLPIPPTPPPVPELEQEQGTVESTRVARLESLRIDTDDSRATVRWTTNSALRYMLRWGRTDTFTGGYVSNDVYRTTHITTITDLEPGTRYEYELIGYTPTGRAVTLERGTFVTESDTVTRAVGNVERLSAVLSGAGVRLTFRIPETEPGAQVRVVRNHFGFPSDLNDGAVIYEGTAESVFDPDAFARSSVGFYTVFVIAADGRISSGAVAIVYADTIARDEGSEQGAVALATSTPDLGTSTEITLPLLEGNDIIIQQTDLEYTFLDTEIELSPYHRFVMVIPKEALPRHLKSIIVSVVDPSDQRVRYTFLLRLNSLGTAYEAAIEPIGVLGESRIQVEVYDYDQMVIGRYAKVIRFVPERIREQVVIFPDAFIAVLRPFTVLVTSVFGVLILMVLLLYVWRRRTEDND